VWKFIINIIFLKKESILTIFDFALFESMFDKNTLNATRLHPKSFLGRKINCFIVTFFAAYPRAQKRYTPTTKGPIRTNKIFVMDC
jgi:hypothetical protein